MSPNNGCDDAAATALLGTLQSPTRNRYFYGKMLDAQHLTLEQNYYNRLRWMMNRLSLGSGVLCGLEINPPQPDGTTTINPGVAVDALGREIIVPVQSQKFDPLKLAAQNGGGGSIDAITQYE